MRALGKFLLLLLFFLLGVFLLIPVFLGSHYPDIYYAVKSGDTNGVARYLSAGSNINAQIRTYHITGSKYLTAPPLHLAIENSNTACIKFLLDHGAIPDTESSRGETALTHLLNTCESPPLREEILRLLVAHGADPNYRARIGSTPLIKAVEYNQFNTVSNLLSLGATLSTTDSLGLTAIHYAPSARMVDVLVSAGADPHERHGKETPADTAKRLYHLEALKALTNLPAAKKPDSQAP